MRVDHPCADRVNFGVCHSRYHGAHLLPVKGPIGSDRVDRTRERRTIMSDDDSPPKGEKDPDRKAYCRHLAGLALKAALAAALRALFDWLARQ